MPKWKVDLLHGLLLILISYFSLCAGYDYDYDDIKDPWGRCPWIRNGLKNGRVRIRSRGRIAKFTCKSGYELVGRKFATCVRGQWNNPVPVCIARGCPRITAMANGIVTQKYRGAQLTFDCNPGYTLQGDPSIFCDGSQWDKSVPRCEADPLQAQKYCDFEDPDLCGWSHDPTHDFDWRRHQFKTPSGHVGTGPSYDHTFGEGKAGYYMYEEASAPRNVNDTSRLFSPVYASNDSQGCFVFWYHMYGSTIGSLRVYIKPESHVFVELTPVWEKSGNQGDEWLRGNVTVPRLGENFQIVFEGIRGMSYLGDTAIDDANLLKASCSSLDSLNTTEGEKASGESCRGRCHEPDNSTSCGCTDACEANNTCCSDYAKLCVERGSEPPSGENETATGKQETDFTPEDKVGTQYTATAPVLSTESVTLSDNQSAVTENNNQQPLTTTSSPTITFGMNSSTEASAIPPYTLQVSINSNTTETVSQATQRTKILSTPETITVKAETTTSTVPITTTKGTTTPMPTTTKGATTGEATATKGTTTGMPTTTKEATTPMPTTRERTTTGVPTTTKEATTPMPTTRERTTTAGSTMTKIPLTKPSQVTAGTIISTSALPNLTSPVSGTNSTPGATTYTTAMLSAVTETTIKTMPTTKWVIPTVVTIPGVESNLTTRPTSSQTVKPTTVIPKTSRIITSRTTIRILRPVTTASTIPSTSTAVTTKLASTKASTQAPARTARPYRPAPPRRTSVFPLISTTLSTNLRSTRTTKATNFVSVLYTTKSQVITATPQSVGSSPAVKSNSAGVLGASLGVIIVLCLIGGVTFVFLRRRRQKLNKLHGDAIRFLPDDEVIEYSEASATDSFLTQ